MKSQGMTDQGMMCQPQAQQMADGSPMQKMMGCCPMMGKGMRGDMKPTSGGLFGSQVTPRMNLLVDDVRDYLVVQLDQLNNKRLKVGDVKADEKTITADIVTLDNSLVQRLGVDRRTGGIEYRN
jgi:hypothetical protein